MKLRMFFLTLFLMLPTVLPAKATDCNDPIVSPEQNAAAQRAWESRTSPVYQDATELAETLDSHGVHVQCIRSSVGERFFPGEKGAAWFKTDRGVFDAWFLPESETFADINIDERSENDRYVYTFRGTPHILRTMDSSKQIYFVHSGSVLIHVSGDAQLAASLRNALPTP